MGSSLPSGWRYVAIGEIASERAEKVSPEPNDQRPYIALEHIAGDCGDLLGHDLAHNASSDKSAFKAGDILFGKLRPNLRKCVQAPFDGVCSTDIVVIFPTNGTRPRLLLHLLRTEAVMQHADRTSMGTKMPRTSWAEIAACHVLLPPTDTHQRICDSLDGIEEAIRATGAMIEQTCRVKSSLLDQFVLKGLPGRRTKLTTYRLGELFDERKERGRPGLPTFSVTMDSGLVDRESMDRRVISDLAPAEHLLVRKGDIAYNMMRMWQGVFGLAANDGIVSPAYVVLTPKPIISSHYASYLFSHRTTIRKFERFSQGLTEDRLRLYFDEFAPIKVEIPDLDTQHIIATTLQAVDDRIKSEAERLEVLIKLKAALSQGLLTGKIPVATVGTGKQRKRKD